MLVCLTSSFSVAFSSSTAKLRRRYEGESEEEEEEGLSDISPFVCVISSWSFEGVSD